MFDLEVPAEGGAAVGKFERLLRLAGRDPRVSYLRVLWLEFSWLRTIYSSTTNQEDTVVDMFRIRARAFLRYLKTHFPVESVTPKLHYLGYHYWEFLRDFGSMGRYAEQAYENIHQIPIVEGRKGRDQLKAQLQKHSWGLNSS